MASVREKIERDREEKEARYRVYRVLLDEAMRAGRAAVLEAGDGCGHPVRRGAVWLKLADGRSSFAHFVIQEHGDTWQQGNRRTGIFLAVQYEDYVKALAYAQAARDVLLGGGVDVSIETKSIDGPEE